MLSVREIPFGLLGPHARRGQRAGTILLEVILALGIFFVVAGIVFGGLRSSLNTVQRVVVRTQAADLAVTKLSEIRLGELEVADDGPNAYEQDERLADWTWQIIAAPVEADTLLPAPETRLEVVIRHTPSGQVYRLVHLLLPQEGGRYRREPEEPGLLEAEP